MKRDGSTNIEKRCTWVMSCAGHELLCSKLATRGTPNLENAVFIRLTPASSFGFWAPQIKRKEGGVLTLLM